MATAPEGTLLILLLILLFGLIVPELSKKIRIPFVTSLIILGAILGPYGFNYIQTNETIDFFAFLGMTFLMLMAGIETHPRQLRRFKFKIVLMAAFNGLIPFAVGLGIGKFFGYSWFTSFLLGVIFVSSSAAVVVPALKSEGMFKKEVGQVILAAILVVDILSLMLLSFLLQEVSPITKLPLLSYFVIIIISIIALFWFVPKVTRYFFRNEFDSQKQYERQLRFVMVVLMAVLIYFSALGVHPILAAFLVGITLSGSIRSEEIFEKFYTLGYGLFVPIFLFIVGMQMDLTIFYEFDVKNILMISIVLGLIVSKFFSGWLGGKAAGLSKYHSIFFGSASIVQLTTTLSVTYAAATLGILDSTLVTSIIALSIITTVIGPTVLHILPNWKKKLA